MEVIIKPMAACRILRSCVHSADGEALGPPDSRQLVPDMVALDLRAGTEVLMRGRLLRSRETTLDRGEHHEAGRFDGGSTGLMVPRIAAWHRRLDRSEKEHAARQCWHEPCIG
jgi:hypothetical protein